MATYFERKRDGAGTHVLILGVATYPSAPDFALKPAFHSAVHMATWFRDRFDNPEAPLASVELLTSAADPDWRRFLSSDDGDILIERPTFDTVQAAVATWMKRADSHPDNIAVFYFAGQGKREGAETLLLMDDFSGFRTEGSTQVVNFVNIPEAMRNCAARRQLYLVDAGYEISTDVFLRGWPLLDDKMLRRRKPPRRAIFYPRVPGGRSGPQTPKKMENRPNLFAMAFTDAFDEAAQSRPISMEALAKKVVRRLQDQQPLSIDITEDFNFHQPPPPEDPTETDAQPMERAANEVRTVSAEVPEAAAATAKAAAPATGAEARPGREKKPRTGGKARAKPAAPTAGDAGSRSQSSPAERREADEANTDFVLDDAEAERDALGRSALAIGLARRLHKIWRRTNEEAVPAAEARAAFVVHLDAPWGGGKTSFANFLARVLNPSPRGAAPARFLREHYPGADLGGIFLDDPPPGDAAAAAFAALPADARRPWIVVTFNAWQAEHCAPPWWVFYQAIRKDCFKAIRVEGDIAWTPRPPQARPRWRSALDRRLLAVRAAVQGKAQWLLLAVREYLWRFGNPKILSVILVAAIGSILLLVLRQMGILDTGQLKTWLPILTGALAGLWGLAAFFTESIAPGTASVAERLSLGAGDPFARFRTHFARMMARVRRPVMVVVDDLDRCRPDFVVDLVRGIQTSAQEPARRLSHPRRPRVDRARLREPSCGDAGGRRRGRAEFRRALRREGDPIVLHPARARRRRPAGLCPAGADR